MRWAVVRQIVKDLSPATILEIGCGQGAFGARLAKDGNYVGVEPDSDSFAVARSRISATNGLVLNVGSDELERDRTFELVCAFEVLEHMEDDLATLSSWRDLVVP